MTYEQHQEWNKSLEQEVHWLRKELDNLYGALWAIAFSAPECHVTMNDVNRRAYSKRNCRLEFLQDPQNRRTVIRASIETPCSQA